MYLSRVELDPTRRSTMAALVAPQKLHGAVESAFAGERRRRLWRLDRLGERLYLLLLSEDAALLQQLQQALLHPAFPLYLGRRCCPPTLPLCLGVRPGSLQEVLQAEPPLCPGRQSRILLDADPLEPGTAPQRDVPVSFDPHHRQYGYRSVRELWQKVPDSPETTEHDPFREL